MEKDCVRAQGAEDFARSLSGSISTRQEFFIIYPS